MATTYIAKKPCRFGDKSYLIGEKIPGNKILPRRIGSLLRMGVIVESEDEKVSPLVQKVEEEKVSPPVQKPEDEKVQKTKPKEESKEKTEK